MHDPLSEVLRTLKFEGAVYLHGEFSAPWCARAQYGIPLAHVLMSGADHVVSFHVLIKGHCRARMVDGDAAVDLAAGDLVMFVADDRHHLIGTDLALPALDADAAFADGLPAGVLQLGHGGGGEVTQIICGYLACNRRMTRPLLSALAPMQKIRLCDDGDTAWLLDLLHLGVRESRSCAVGAGQAL